MLQKHENDGIEEASVVQELELDAPAASSPAALLAKAGSLTGALVQRGRERAPRLVETSIPGEAEGPTPSLPAAEPTLVPPAPLLALPAPPKRGSRWTDVLFVAACCVAFFATFLFVLRF